MLPLSKSVFSFCSEAVRSEREERETPGPAATSVSSALAFPRLLLGLAAALQPPKRTPVRRTNLSASPDAVAIDEGRVVGEGSYGVVVAASDAAEKPRTPDGSVFLSTSYG